MTQQLEERLRDAHSHINPGPAPDHMRRRLDALIANAPCGQHSVPAPRRWRPAPLVLAGAGMAVTGLLVVALLPGSSGTTGPASARAACVTPGPATRCGSALREAAAAFQIPGAGEVLYRRGSFSVTAFTVTADPSGGPNELSLPAARRPFTVERRGIEEQWFAPDGSGRSAHTDPGPATLPTAADRTAWQAAGRPDLENLVPKPKTERPLASDFPADTANELLLGANGLSESLATQGDPLAALPQTATALATWLQQKAWERRIRPAGGCASSLLGCTNGQRRLVLDTVVSDIETLLAYPVTAPELRAILITVLTRQDGARSLGIVRDPEQREVAAVQLGNERQDGDGANVVAFDPSTGELRGIATNSDTGLRWQRLSDIVSARVQQVGARP